jgi:hypothetical protein
MKIKADFTTIYSLTSEPAPVGITIEKSAAKSFNTQLNINIDPAEIIKAVVVASWIVSAAIVSLRRGKDVHVNGKALPPEEAVAIKMVTDVVDSEQKENQNRK